MPRVSLVGLLGLATFACTVDVDPTGFQPVASGPASDATSTSSGGDTGSDSTTTSTGDSSSTDAEPSSESTTLESDASSASDTSTTSGEDSSSSGVAPPPPPPCQLIYGDVEDFELCDEEADRCRFITDLDGDTCGELCQDLGTTCLGAQATDEDQGLCVDLGENHDCDTEAQIEICICSRA